MGVDVSDIPDEKKKSKFNNLRTPCRQGHMHRSIKESDWCNAYEVDRKTKKIKKYDVEVPFVLMKGFNYKGERVRDITYRADFVVKNLDGSTEIVDTKGVQTRVFKDKWKMMKKKFKDRDDVILKIV